MKITASNHPGRVAARAGFTILELTIAMFVGAILIASVVMLTVFTSRTFAMMGNYVDMNSDSRNAVDAMSREIRNASNLLAVGTNPPSLLFTNATGGYATQISYDPGARTVTMTKSGQGQVVYLTGCDNWNYSLYNKVPIVGATNITFYTTASLNQVKVINLSWTCSRDILGSKLNTEIVITAQVVLRNKTAD